MMPMKKAIAVLLSCMIIVFTSVNTTSAVSDPNVYVGAYIGFVMGSNSLVTGKAYAVSTNPNFSYINVNGKLYKSGALVESGVGSSGTAGIEASWETNHYNHLHSYTLQSASRTYYTDGTSSSQSYNADNW